MTDETKRRHASRHLRNVRKAIGLLAWLDAHTTTSVATDLLRARSVESRLAAVVGL